MAKIYVVDDSKFMGDMIADIVQEMGYDVEYISGGQALLERYAKERADVVILDVVMEDMYGIRVLEKLEEMDAGVRVLVCSALGKQQPLVEEALKAGAYACMSKPFTAKDMIEAIEKGLKG